MPKINGWRKRFWREGIAPKQSLEYGVWIDVGLLDLCDPGRISLLEDKRTGPAKERASQLVLHVLLKIRQHIH